MLAPNHSLSNKFLSALDIEKRADYETTHELLSTTPPKVLARNGLAILNLVIDNIRTSIGGKLIVELIADSAISGFSIDSKPNKSKKPGKSNRSTKSFKSKDSGFKSSNNSSIPVNQLENGDFKPGDIVRIDTYSANSNLILKKLQNSSKSEDNETLEVEKVEITGVVTSSSNSRICVALSNAALTPNSVENSDSTNSVTDCVWELQASSQRIWIVKVSNETTYRRMESTLRKLSEFSLESISSNLEYAPPIVQYLLGTQPYLPPSSLELANTRDKLTLRNKRLNTSQQEAIIFGLVSPLTIVHGPPGTGKTSTLVEYIIQHLEIYPSKRILISAPSNIAADTIIERLSNYFDGNKSQLVRIGHPARILPTTRKHSLDFIVSQLGGEELDDLQLELSKLEKEVRKPRTSKRYVDRRELWKEIKDLKKEYRERSKKGVRDVLIGSKVVVSTLHGSGSWEIVGNLYNNNMSTTNVKGFGKGFFHTVIIDEVSQALEPACWIPIVNHGPERLVLAGDNKQLPPTIHLLDKDAEESNSNLTNITNKRAYNILSQSLFDRIVRLYGGNEQKIIFIKFLDTQYRMCEKCMEFPSKEWYNDDLKADDSVKNCTVYDLVKHNKLETMNDDNNSRLKNSRSKVRKSKRQSIKEEEESKQEDVLASIERLDISELEERNDLIEQVIWYDTQGGSCPESIEIAPAGSGKLLGIGGSKYNVGECFVVQKHICALINLGVKEEDIGVIAPYSAQVAKLRSLLWAATLGSDQEGESDSSLEEDSRVYPGVEISTVDGFQGREKEVIILSLVRSNFGGSNSKDSWESADVGFLSDFRRLNVSITRCKKQLAIIGDMETLEQSGIQMLKDWCEWCTENADIRYVDV